MKKKLLLTLVILVFIVAGFLALALNGLAGLEAATLNGISMNDLPDGRYAGRFEYTRWSNEVLVEVQDNRILSIVITDDVFGAQITGCSAEIIRRVIAKQDTLIDTVSGATATSKAYLKAIEKALSQK